MSDFEDRRIPPAELGAALRAARVRAGHRVRETARLAGVSASYLSALRRGLRCPSVPMAEVLARVLPLLDHERQVPQQPSWHRADTLIPPVVAGRAATGARRPGPIAP
ncbi:helix-turn-helix domain-containing protein [Kitasatospora indigofera]|uniref:helix-turn-helix domain-containing protein n=2 Tax=Streptomycetaceae TaxID=2062 RepID=UPI00367E6E86